LSGGAWPSAQGKSKRAEAVFQAKLDAAKEHAKAVDARAQANADQELELLTEFHKAIFDVSKASIDRARAGADAVQKAATAILAIYTAVLGVAFSVGDNPLPSRGVVPAVFLGLALVLSTVYLAYLTPARGVDGPPRTASLRDAEHYRTQTFILWTREIAQNRRQWLHRSVVALGIALAFLPAPFVGSLPLFDRIHRSPSPAVAVRPWPPPPSGAQSDLALRKILYQAQVAEAASARAGPQRALVNANRSWWFAGALGLVLTFLIPALLKDDQVGARGALQPVETEEPG
jgi:hypothetical protein